MMISDRKLLRCRWSVAWTRFSNKPRVVCG